MAAVLTIDQVIEKAKESPALKEQHVSEDKFCYPKRYEGKVPLKVKVKMTVMPDLPLIFVPDGGTVCIEGNEYYVWVNKYGAVSAILHNGERLGLKPNEFEVIEFHEQNKQQ